MRKPAHIPTIAWRVIQEAVQGPLTSVDVHDDEGQPKGKQHLPARLYIMRLGSDPTKDGFRSGALVAATPGALAASVVSGNSVHMGDGTRAHEFKPGKECFICTVPTAKLGRLEVESDGERHNTEHDSRRWYTSKAVSGSDVKIEQQPSVGELVQMSEKLMAVIEPRQARPGRG